MITRIKHRRILLAALLIAVIVAASSFCFELEPSASEESRRGLDLWSESEEAEVPEIYAAEAEPIFSELGSESEVVPAEPEQLLQGLLNAAKTNNKLQQEACETALEQSRMDDMLAETADVITVDTEGDTDETPDEDIDDEGFFEEESSNEDSEDPEEEFYAWGYEEDSYLPDYDEEESYEEESYEEEDETVWTAADPIEDDENEEDSQDDESSAAQEESEPQIDYSAYSDLDLLAAICQIEAGSNYEGALAVANVVLNRLHCGYASSIYGVIFAPYQFATGSMAYYLQNGTSDAARTAAQDALNGINNVGSYLSFNGRAWLDPTTLNCPYVEIGGNVFY